MRYLIIDGKEAFYTNWFDHRNFYKEGQIVVDLHNHKFTTDGRTWTDILEDKL